ncbi:hypothetical protein E2542_SST11518 [Spatholobus suberectus]|nr:hypothetical protein E2542_SST11518 [Spatholobus suberectus]
MPPTLTRSRLGLVCDRQYPVIEVLSQSHQPLDLGVKSNGDTSGSGVRSCGALISINRETASFPFPTPHQTSHLEVGFARSGSSGWLSLFQTH